MKKIIFFLGLSLHACCLLAQDEFDKKAGELRGWLTGKDTVLYNGSYLKAVSLHKNGNIRLTTGDTDSLAFNLLLLQQVWLDQDSTYNQYGFHLHGNSLLLLIEGTSEGIEFNDKGEVSVVRKTLPVFELKFPDAEHASAAARAFLQVRSLCRLDQDSFRPRPR
jgi:hypothetical protein